jgi:hypothetical protein
MENNTQKSSFGDKAKSVHHVGAAILTWGKIILYAAAIGALIYAAYYLYNMFSMSETKTQTFVMNEWKVMKAQEIVLGKITGRATGRYGYRKVIHSNLPFIGERHDTMCWSCPGSKFVDIDGKVKITLGYDMLGGDRIFSDNAVGTLRETSDSLILQVTTDYPVPKALEEILKTIPKRSNSYFSAAITDEEFYNYADTALARSAGVIIKEENEFFRGAYAESMIGILSQSLTPVAQGKSLRIDLVVNGTPYVPDGRKAERLIDREFPIGKEISY